MSEENVDLAWRASNAWNEGGDEAVLQYLDPQVEWHPPDESMEPGIYHGHDGVRDYLGRLGEMFTQRRIKPLEVLDVDDERVVAIIRVTARSEHFDMEIDAEWAWLIRFRDGKGVYVKMFTSRNQALEATGSE